MHVNVKNRGSKENPVSISTQVCYENVMIKQYILLVISDKPFLLLKNHGNHLI